MLWALEQFNVLFESAYALYRSCRTAPDLAHVKRGALAAMDSNMREILSLEHYLGEPE